MDSLVPLRSPRLLCPHHPLRWLLAAPEQPQPRPAPIVRHLYPVHLLRVDMFDPLGISGGKRQGATVVITEWHADGRELTSRLATPVSRSAGSTSFTSGLKIRTSSCAAPTDLALLPPNDAFPRGRHEAALSAAGFLHPQQPSFNSGSAFVAEVVPEISLTTTKEAQKVAPRQCFERTDTSWPPGAN